MKREWLEKFYTECGREVTLAYTVLNHTNNWAVGLGGAVLAAILVSGGVRVTPAKVQVLYPRFTLWAYVIIAWIVMIRFFARSCLALSNMYRWNTLIFATAKVLSVEDNHADAPTLRRNLWKLIDAYYFGWHSTMPLYKIVWYTLKLMYFWFLLGLLALIGWGAVALKHDTRSCLVLGLFLLATIYEVAILRNWYGLKYQPVTLDPEPTIGSLWGMSGAETAPPSIPGAGDPAMG